MKKKKYNGLYICKIEKKMGEASGPCWWAAQAAGVEVIGRFGRCKGRIKERREREKSLCRLKRKIQIQDLFSKDAGRRRKMILFSDVCFAFRVYTFVIHV